MIELVLRYIGEELGQLIVHACGVSIVLDIEMTVAEKGQGRTIPRGELQFIVEYGDNLKWLVWDCLPRDTSDL